MISFEAGQEVLPCGGVLREEVSYVPARFLSFLDISLRL